MEAGLGDVVEEVEEELGADELAYLSESELLELLNDSPSQWLLCTEGVLRSLQSTVVRLVAFALLRRALVIASAKGQLRIELVKWILCFCGLCMIYSQNSHLICIFLYLSALCSISFFRRYLSPYSGFASLFAGIICILVCQVMLPADVFMSIRGVLMVMLMKISSAQFDLDSGTYETISPSTLLSYLLDSSSVVFGPWFSLRQFEESLEFHSFKEELRMIGIGVAQLVVSLLFVLYSSCYVENIFFGGSYLWTSFGTAQAFRCSHYFVSWLSGGALALSGIQISIVSDFLRVEWPRSLVDVVISWDIPMHRFLHKYVFNEVRHKGAPVAIFVTYAVSSLLHGANFQLSAVLLSLGLYTFVETKFRSKLCACLNACVAAKKCKPNCSHSFKESSALAICVNILLRMLSVCHLAYLGMPFDDSAAETGYSAAHTLSVWSKCLFASHLFTVLIFIISLFL